MSGAEVPPNPAGQVLISLPSLKGSSAFCCVQPVIQNCSGLSNIPNASTVVTAFEGPHVNVFFGSYEFFMK